MTREVAASYAVRCEGVSDRQVAPLADRPAQPSLTIFKDGTRLVGCPYLSFPNGMCHAVEEPDRECIQLFPLVNTVALLEKAVEPANSLIKRRERATKATMEEIDGHKVRVLREHLRISQNAVGRDAHMANGYLSDIETGRVTRLGHSKMERLANILGVNLEQLRP